jgi:hypothetical protein
MIILYTVVPCTLAVLGVATGIYLYKRRAELKAVNSVSARSETPFHDYDMSNSKKEIMSEFKLPDEEKGVGRSRNGPRDFYDHMTSAHSLTSMHTTVDPNDPMITG